MGLAIEPGGARWSYSGFSAFRRKLARMEGLVLDEMERFGGSTSWEASSGADLTVLRPLLDHSDCDGHLDSWDCEQMVPRLKAIHADAGNGLDDYDRGQLAALVVGMEHCAGHRCAMTFS